MEKNENIHHSFHLLVEALHRGTLAGVPVAEAVAAHHHVVDGIVVLFPDLHPWVQEVISQRVQLDELDSQIRDLQEVCRGHQKKKTCFGVIYQILYWMGGSQQWLPKHASYGQIRSGLISALNVLHIVSLHIPNIQKLH